MLVRVVAIGLKYQDKWNNLNPWKWPNQLSITLPCLSTSLDSCILPICLLNFSPTLAPIHQFTQESYQAEFITWVKVGVDGTTRVPLKLLLFCFVIMLYFIYIFVLLSSLWTKYYCQELWCSSSLVHIILNQRLFNF